LWAHASNTARLEQSFWEIADQVKVRGRKDPQADVFKLVHDWLHDEQNGRWLLVLDNADDAAVLSITDGSALQQHLSRYIPWSRHGSVLVTSRSKRAAMQVVEDSDIILIEPMHGAAAHALLCKKLRDVDEKDDSIAKLATTLDHMPLALVQAAAYIRERAPRCSVRQYLEEYRQSDSRKTSLLNREAGHLRRDAAASNSVLITWQISFDHIRSTRQSAAGLLSLMSFFDRQGIQEAVLRGQSGTADDRFEEDVLALRDYSFVTITRDARTFEMHSLVQLATRTWLEGEGQLDRWRAQFISNLCAELPTGEHKNWEKCQALFPHAQAALAQRPKDRESLKEWALLLYKAAWYAWQRGRAGEAEEIAVISMEVRSEVLGEDNAETLDSMGMVGLARELGGKYEEAEAINWQTLARKEKVLGHEHPDTLTSMNNLALVLNRQGKYEEAEVMNRQELECTKKVLGAEHPSTLTSMSNLALVLNRQGKYEEAEAMNRQTLARREKVLGHEHPDTLGNMNNLASVLDSQGKYEEAEAMHRQTLARSEKVLGHEHPHTLTSMNNLAGVLDSQGKYEEAEAMHRQTLARSEKVLGHEHPDTLTSMNNLALVLNRQGKYEEAEAMHRQELALCKKVLGHEHPDTLMSMSNLAEVLNSQGKYGEAEAMNWQTLARREKVLGHEHPDTLTSMSNLALVLDSQGKYEEAEAMHRQTLARSEKVLGPEHPSTLMSIYCLAHLLTHRRRYNESLALYERACAGYQAVLGKDHPTTRACHQHYADALASHNHHQLAVFPTIADSSAHASTGKESKLLRGLAKIGIRSSKSSAR
jgi:tetratricopeptide (TPR) repeat protein